MLAAQLSFCRLPRIAKIAAMLTFPAVAVFGQTAASPATPAQPAAESCPVMAATEIPLNVTLQLKVDGYLDSGHLKPGKEVWFKVANAANYPGCALEADASVYAHVIASNSSKNPSASDLSLKFDRADCTGHAKQALQMRLIGVTAPPEVLARLHSAVPTEVAGGARKMSGAAAATTGYDTILNPGGAPHTVQPGIVVGLPKIKLEPQGGPECSAKLSSTDKSIVLAQDSKLILVVAASK
jgi:hypothetical protein